jgi:hypothetical protein
METSVRATAVRRSTRSESVIVEASTKPSKVRMKPRTASRRRPPYWSHRIALLSPADKAAVLRCIARAFHRRTT